jgi:LCP family protein required for cell wall assembly
VKRQFMQFNTSRGQNNISPSGEQSSEEASAQAREAAPEPYASGQKKTGLLANYASSSQQGVPNSAQQPEPPAASWAIRDDAPPAASWAIRDDAPPAASWAYVDEQPTSITPELPAERFTDPFMRRDEAEDFLAKRVSPHESAIEHSPFTQNRGGAPGPMQRPQQPAPRPANYVQAPPPAQQRPTAQPMTPPSPGWGPQQLASFAPAQRPGPVQGPPRRYSGPPQAGYMGNPAPAGWQQQQGPMVLSNSAAPGYVNGPPPSMHSAKAGKAARKKKRFPIWFTAIAAVLVAGIAVGGYFASPYINIVSSSTSQTATHFDTTTGKNKGSAAQATSTNSGPILSKRTNILLLGSDTDAKFDGGSYLAQTDIIVTIDPATKYVGMLSIPRDLQVDIPGYPANKLDWAFSYGYQSKKTSSPYADGAGLAIATIEQNFGIPIDAYAWVGLDGFIKVINTAGGVDVDVTHPMVDDTYPDDVSATTGQTHTDLTQSYGYKRLYIAPGPQHLNGIQALEYVRTRHSDLVGDFGRSVRQQQVLDQLKAKLETPAIISQLPQLATDLNGYVKTSMSLTDLASLGNFARTINSSSIDRLVLGPPYSVAMTNSTNFAPVCDKIIPAIQKMFSLDANTATCVPQTSANTAGVASSNIPSSTVTNQNSTVSSTSTAEASAQAMTQLARTNIMSIVSSHNDPLGVQSLLDLMFMVVLESFDAMTTT